MNANLIGICGGYFWNKLLVFHFSRICRRKKVSQVKKKIFFLFSRAEDIHPSTTTRTHKHQIFIMANQTTTGVGKLNFFWFLIYNLMVVNINCLHFWCVHLCSTSFEKHQNVQHLFFIFYKMEIFLWLKKVFFCIWFFLPPPPPPFVLLPTNKNMRRITPIYYLKQPKIFDLIQFFSFLYPWW